ncbi:MAG: N-acetyl-alpha-D-glucosaminyl L-malate synthase BshA [Ignavibacteria bacterium GWA2_55_11]|nr:MAG: N-acetyl-alpha-D-glucosaminyl L-malate synthase BshA [Ignavibacteria bacterium GWA2_55_11]OGU44456.1 MAG: N-acetyl-alpha-D-glucosaminyl L-malate synthase BshA [Ignavibacteria bacterium GWC2_56_12]OGU68284.1 MAG: N-acetyl-alpha-D-glucosaminyl L-malate synthase BshA [Ignavibacteria bacterium RIFCSPHIGHO2_02_FULL_56_12]OGU72227.1 MAG: N-acetyl-alpha-D-glucosaminyl L-malate synthase BshA [Ignavibacteria bacterium RIFCSPLOWO2_02_FULL_55_14]OGU72257.1 MAG: N-acetyl-alpha-D-glucosaminyl L-mala
MKIGITCYPTYGGSGVVATELGKALARRGHQVHFISYAIPMRLAGFQDNIFYHEVEMSSYPLFDFPLYTLALSSKMVEVAQYEKLDIFHCHYAIPHATSAYLAKQVLHAPDIRVVTTLHGTDITLVGLEPSFLPILRFSIEQSDGVTAVSRFLREKTLTNYGINKAIEVIPNFVDTTFYRRLPADHVRKRYCAEGGKILVHTSNFRPVKRVQDVIRIFGEVHKKVHSTLLLIGDGPDRSQCELLTRELGLQDSVHFLGKQIDIVELLSAADLFLMPSQSESFGLSALEAMACEVPIISSSVGGLPELQVHGQTGFIAEIGDIDRMARYAIDLLSNPAKHRMFAQSARRRAVEFDSERIVTQYEQYYQRILSHETVGAK